MGSESRFVTAADGLTESDLAAVPPELFLFAFFIVKPCMLDLVEVSGS